MRAVLLPAVIFLLILVFILVVMAILYCLRYCINNSISEGAKTLEPILASIMILLEVILSKDCHVYGIHAISAVHDLYSTGQALVSESKESQDLMRQLSLDHKMNLDIVYCENGQLVELVGEQAVHQGVVAVCFMSEALSENDMYALIKRIKDPVVVLLDQVQDPHIAGACLRTANAMGASAVLVCRKTNLLV